MKLLITLVVWGLVAGLANSIMPTGAQARQTYPATPSGSPSVIPASPVGEQLTWVLAQFNGDASTLTQADIDAHFEPAFLAGFPFPLLDLLRETASQYAPVRVTGFPFPPTATGAVMEVELDSGEQAAIYLVVAAEPPYRITRLDLSETPAPESDAGQRVPIAERSLYLECRGTGAPVVVLEGGITTDWSAVLDDVSAFTRVCSYDRPDSPGSRSDPTAMRTGQEVVDDLRALLTAAGETGPYVLVGHSMGGLYVQLYAYQYPNEVAGLVLVDPTSEEFSSRLGDLLLELGTPMPAGSPPPSPEEADFAQMREAREAGPLPSVPLIVLSHGRAADPADRPSGWPIDEEERIWLDLHAEIARSVPGGEHVVAEGSGHDIHQEEPQLVISAIQRVVDAARELDIAATSPT